MKITIEATSEEIAALIAQLQERQSRDAGDGNYVAVREPYQRHYSLVEVRRAQK